MESPPTRPAKTVLGRGLGNLLGTEAAPATTPAAAAADEVPRAAAPLTPGVGALLRGGNGRGGTGTGGVSRENNATATATATATVPVSAPAQAAAGATGPNMPAVVTSALAATSGAPVGGRSLQLPLLVADLLLLGLVGVLLLRGDGRPGVLELGLGLVAVGVGAWLGCLAFLSSRRRD